MICCHSLRRTSGWFNRTILDPEVRVFPPQPASPSLTHTESGRANRSAYSYGGYRAREGERGNPKDG
jgi:hypothetical protein